MRGGCERIMSNALRRGGEDGAGTAGQTDVSEQSERWRLIDWFVGGRIISRTRTRRLAFVYVRACVRTHRGLTMLYARPRPRAEISNVAMSTGAARTDARTELRSGGTYVRVRRARWNTVRESAEGETNRVVAISFDERASDLRGVRRGN